MPAEGWREAFWENKGATADTVEVFTWPLIGWALVERLGEGFMPDYVGDDGIEYYQSVDPLRFTSDGCAGVEPSCSDDSLGIYHPSMRSVEDLREAAVESWERKTARARKGSG